MKEMTIEERIEKAALRAHKANAYREIQNAAAGHLYSYRAQQQLNEINTYWCRERDDIMYFGAVGHKEVLDFYWYGNMRMRNEKLKIVNKYHPEIEVCPENDGMGDMVAKSACMPYIVIAEDGKSARATWLSPGMVCEVGPNGKPKPAFMQERLSLNLMSESDYWRILELSLGMDFISDIPSDFVSSDDYEGRTFDLFEKDENAEPMPRPYSVTKKASYDPPLPKPYATWQDEMSMVK